MNPVLAAAIYFILFWLCLFVVLPIGVRSVEETGEGIDQGHDRGAPTTPNLRKKVVWAAGGAMALLVGIITILQVVYYGAPLN